MAKNFAEIAFTDDVKKLQEENGSRHIYARMEESADYDGLTGSEMDFIRERDSFYLATIGEKLEVANAAYFDGQTAVYLHRRSSDLPPQVGVVVQYEGDDSSIARTTAMQVAAMRPQYLSADEVPAELLDNERRIAEATAKEEGKPERAVPRIVEGRVNAFLKDVCLLNQPSVTDNKTPVQNLLDNAGVKVTRFVRFEAAA